MHPSFPLGDLNVRIAPEAEAGSAARTTAAIRATLNRLIAAEPIWQVRTNVPLPSPSTCLEPAGVRRFVTPGVTDDHPSTRRAARALVAPSRPPAARVPPAPLPPRSQARAASHAPPPCSRPSPLPTQRALHARRPAPAGADGAQAQVGVVFEGLGDRAFGLGQCAG